mgnify:CR=1 FL=1
MIDEKYLIDHSNMLKQKNRNYFFLSYNESKGDYLVLHQSYYFPTTKYSGHFY